MGQLEATAMANARGDGGSHQVGAIEAGEKADSGIVWGGDRVAWASWMREGRRQGVCC